MQKTYTYPVTWMDYVDAFAPATNPFSQIWMVAVVVAIMIMMTLSWFIIPFLGLLYLVWLLGTIVLGLSFYWGLNDGSRKIKRIRLSGSR